MSFYLEAIANAASYYDMFESYIPNTDKSDIPLKVILNFSNAAKPPPLYQQVETLKACFILADDGFPWQLQGL